jgi:hypothetical protein
MLFIDCRLIVINGFALAYGDGKTWKIATGTGVE